jgi:hypothetical protein
VDELDRARVLEHLALAERHIAEGEKHLRRQEDLILEMQRDGLDTDQALDVLATLRETQALHHQDRERIQRELEE